MIPTFRLFINENSTVNAIYGVFVVYLPLRPQDMKFEPTPVLRPPR